MHILCKRVVCFFGWWLNLQNQCKEISGGEKAGELSEKFSEQTQEKEMGSLGGKRRERKTFYVKKVGEGEKGGWRVERRKPIRENGKGSRGKEELQGSEERRWFFYSNRKCLYLPPPTPPPPPTSPFSPLLLRVRFVCSWDKPLPRHLPLKNNNHIFLHV